MPRKPALKSVRIERYSQHIETQLGRLLHQCNNIFNDWIMYPRNGTIRSLKILLERSIFDEIMLIRFYTISLQPFIPIRVFWKSIKTGYVIQHHTRHTMSQNVRKCHTKHHSKPHNNIQMTHDVAKCHKKTPKPHNVIQCHKASSNSTKHH